MSEYRGWVLVEGTGAFLCTRDNVRYLYVCPLRPRPTGGTLRRLFVARVDREEAGS